MNNYSIFVPNRKFDVWSMLWNNLIIIKFSKTEQEIAYKCVKIKIQPFLLQEQTVWFGWQRI